MNKYEITQSLQLDSFSHLIRASRECLRAKKRRLIKHLTVDFIFQSADYDFAFPENISVFLTFFPSECGEDFHASVVGDSTRKTFAALITYLRINTSINAIPEDRYVERGVRR